MVVFLIGTPIYAWSNGRFNIWLTIAMPILGLSVLSAIIPRRERFEAPGLAVRLEDHPRLHEEVRQVAESMGEEMPDETYLDLDVNAAVTEYRKGF